MMRSILLFTSSWMTAHLGKNPSRGGKPPSLNIIIMTIENVERFNKFKALGRRENRVWIFMRVHISLREIIM